MRTLPSRRWGPFRQEWYSICSAGHDEGPNGNCDRCRAGMWHNVVAQRIGHAIYVRWPSVWRWWANRRFFNRTARFLEGHFPNLKMRGGSRP